MDQLTSVIFKKYGYVIVLIVIAGVYFYFSNTSIGFGDALNFVWCTEMGFSSSTNATSHFGYVNLLHLIYVIMPFSAFQIASFFSIIFALITLFIVYHIVLLNTQNKVAALLSLLSFGFSFTFWRQTEIVEVYTFNLAIVSALLYLILRSFRQSSSKYNYWIGILLGLAILVHIKNILLFPAVIFSIYHTYNYNYAKTIINFLPTIFISSTLFILPLLTNNHSLTAVFFENSTVLSKAISHDFYFFITSIIKHTGYLLYNFHLLTFLIGYGIVLLWKGNRTKCLLLLAFGLPFFGFSILFDVPDAYVYALIFYLVLAIFLGESFNYIFQKYASKLMIVLWGLALTSPFMYYSVFQIAQNIDATQEIAKVKSYKGGLKYLLWPGMRHNVGLIPVAKHIKNQPIKPPYYQEMEWNYSLAMDYLEWKDKQK